MEISYEIGKQKLVIDNFCGNFSNSDEDDKVGD